MKKIAVFSLLFIFLVASVWGDHYIWTGAGSDEDWHNYENWDKGSLGTPAVIGEYPGSNPNDTAEIDSGFDVKINSPIDDTLTSLTINGGSLEIESGGSLETTGLTMNDGLLTVDATGSLTAANVTIDADAELIGNITLSGGALSINGSKPNLNITVNGNTTLAADLSASSLTINSGGTLNLASHNITATGTITNNGTLILTGNAGQLSGGTHTSIGGTVQFTGSGTTLSGITHFTDLIIQNGNRTGAGTLSVSGDFELNNGSLDADSLAVTGSSTIDGDITTSGNQTYNGTVTLGGVGTRKLESTGGAITATELVSASSGVTIEASGVITIGSGGITASTGTSGVVRLESTGASIVINGDIEGYQLLAIASSGSVTVDAEIETHSNGAGDESAASIYVNAETFIVNNTATDSIIPGTSGRLCLKLSNPWIDHYNVVEGERWHEHIIKHLVYGAASAQYYDRNGDPISNYTYVNSNTDTGLTFNVDSGYNIYIFNVGNNSEEVTFTVTGSGLIEIHGVYESTELTLHPGSGGLHFVGAEIELTSGNFSTNGAKLTLAGSSNSIKAAGITLNEVEGSGNLTLEAAGSISIGGSVTTSGNQIYDGAVTIGVTQTLKSTGGAITTTGLVTASAGVTIEASGGITIGSGGITASTGTNGIVRLESDGNITVSGAVTGHQLLAITQNGSVTVDVVTISGNNGSEHDSAAIYVKAVSFSATGGTGSITPGVSGQLCLWINEEWSNPDDAVPAGRWHQHVPKILYSFTEDANGDGRLDRIRVQTNVPLNNDFTDFHVSVTGYEVDKIEISALDNTSFYIYLKQKSELDGGNTPRWNVTRNESLKDSTETSFMGNPSTDRNLTPIDTIPPRIAYTLALPGHNQIYVQMSEPVNFIATLLEDSFAIGGAYTITSVEQIGSHGYLLDLDDSFDVNTLVKSNITATLSAGYFEVSGMVDHSTAPAAIDGVAPKYPANWGYTAYANTGNIFVPPHSLIDNRAPPLNGITHAVSAAPVIRRVTDVLVSISLSDDNYFAWPAWARNEKGTIWEFNGTAFLESEESAIELQAGINDSDLPGGNLRLFYIKTARGNSNALWQPFSSLYYFAPNGEADMLSGTPVPLSNLFNYSFSNIDSGYIVEFYFYIGTMYGSSPNTDQFIARLESGAGNWYDRVRPFSFGIQNMSLQRGGVTVLNNVINSDARELAVIRYNLARPGRVTIQVYTLDGTLVKSIRRGEYREAGESNDTWDGTNNSGRAVARGMYFVRVVGPDIDEIRKIMVVR